MQIQNPPGQEHPQQNPQGAGGGGASAQRVGPGADRGGRGVRGDWGRRGRKVIFLWVFVEGLKVGIGVK